jgi:hypothetical protein
MRVKSGRYVVSVLHHPEITRLLVEDHLGTLDRPLTILVGREQGFLQHTLYRLEGYALIHFYFV